MVKEAHAEVDAQLEQLGRVPTDLTALIARYAGTDLRLPRVDELLGSFGSFDSFDKDHVLAPRPSMEATAVGMDAPVGAKAVYPWDSERPAEPQPAEDPSATLPPDRRSEVALTGSADVSDDDERLFRVQPAADFSGREHDFGDGQAYDTVEDGPVVASQMLAESALELAIVPSATTPVTSSALAAATEGTTPRTAASDKPPAVAGDKPFAGAQQAAGEPEQSVAAHAGDVSSDGDASDAFEILVDDEILEIADDEMIIDSDGDETT